MSRHSVQEIYLASVSNIASAGTTNVLGLEAFILRLLGLQAMINTFTVKNFMHEFQVKRMELVLSMYISSYGSQRSMYM